MTPKPYRSVFKRRWMALLSAAVIVWLAVSVAAPDESSGAAGAQPIDVTGATISNEDLENFADFAGRR